MKKALISGVTGQDGSYLCELLLEKGYEVHGIVRRVSTFNRGRIDHLFSRDEKQDGRFHLHYADLNDSSSLMRLISSIQPDEVYNLAAQSHVKISFDIPEFTGNTTGLGTVRLLECLRELGLNTKFYQAGSSEMYGKVQEIPQTEKTPFYPRSPYAVAKLYAHWISVNYRESYGMFICNGILFNHESPRRGENFVTRKISLGVAAIKLGLQNELVLGNLEAKRDWGYAKDYVEGMWRMLQQDHPDDYVIATGETYSVRDFCEKAFSHVGLDYKKYVKSSEKHFRPAEVDLLIGDATKAKQKLGWKPSINFDQLVNLMVDSDVEFLKRQSANRL